MLIGQQIESLRAKSKKISVEFVALIYRAATYSTLNYKVLIVKALKLKVKNCKCNDDSIMQSTETTFIINSTFSYNL